MRIEILSSLLLTALFFSGPGPGRLLPQEDDFEEADDGAWSDFTPVSKRQEKRNQKMDRLLQGAWQLTEFESDDLEDYRRMERGVALFGPGFFSVELHIAYEIDGTDEVGDKLFQSSTFRYRFDENGDMLAKLSIGAMAGGLFERIDFLRPGSVRTFQIEVTENRLEMSRDDAGLRYVFTRLLNSARKPLDIFGRPTVDDGFEVTGFEPPDLDDPIDDDGEEEGDTDGDGERRKRE